VVDWIHLDTEATAQSAATLQGLRMWMTIPSVLLLICGIIVFKKCYKLNDAKMEEITKQLGRS
jgi:melibiose permease